MFLFILSVFVCLPLAADQHEESVRTPRTIEPEKALNAYKLAYPDRIDLVRKSADGWALRMDGTWFFWDEGKLLPEGDLSEGDNYSRHPFYPYSPTLPELPELTPEQKKAFEERINNREENKPRRHPGFYNLLWRIEDRNSSWNQAKTAFFLGKKFLVHRDLLEKLAAVEEELTIRMAIDRGLRIYVASIASMTGYNWRNIAGTSSLSFHAYGAAVDLLPKSTGGKYTYWRWIKDAETEWYIIPYAQRYMPPDSFIEVFEKRGFIWGGKWLYFDTIHFEYRPEILTLNGYSRQLILNTYTGKREWVWVPPEIDSE